MSVRRVAALCAALVLCQPAPSSADDTIGNGACLECHADASTVKKRHLVSATSFAKGPHTEDNGVTCVSCHTEAGKVEEISDHGPLGRARCDGCHTAAADLKRSVHDPSRPGAKAPTCTACHGGAHAIRPATDPLSPVSRRQQATTCAACHDKEVVESFRRSVHGQKGLASDKGPTCSTCHGSHRITAADVTRNPAFKVQQVKTCGRCHTRAAKAFIPSVHGVALLEKQHYASASCVDCHLSHQILPAKDPRSSVHPTRVVWDCARCHANEKLIRRFHLPSDVVGTYALSYHGRAGELGDARVANCSSCHRQHGIFRASDPRSSIHPKNLAASCGKCHPGAGARLLAGRIHVGATRQDNYWAWLVRTFYIWLIVILVGGMVVHNAMDFLRKMSLRARQQRQAPHVVRMTLQERVAHGLLLVSFLALAYTGFALMYPKAWWVAPLNWISATESFRATVHRIAGLVLSAVALHHLWFIFLHRLGREQRRRLQPRLRDFVDLWHNLLFFVGWRRERPRFARFSYMEKVEYWSLVWGTVVMMLTGLVLWFEEWALGFMPLWLWDVFRVVHRFEAILAVLAVLVWHLYYVLLNPDEAPMALTWLTGRQTHHELAQQHPEELAELMREPPAGHADERPRGGPA